MVIRYHEMEGRYVDSILLMGVTRDMEKQKGVIKAGAMAATEENLGIFRDLGFDPPKEVKSTSILLAVEAQDKEMAQKVIDFAIDDLDRQQTRGTEDTYTLDELGSMIEEGDFPVLFISTPGEYVKGLALQGIEAGVHLHIFSSNVPLDDEKEMKSKAVDKGLLVMGPDAGTTIIGGKGLGFANSVRRGEIGIVGSSGTGIQELTVLLHKGGLGVSAAIGVGSNDLTKEIGAAVTNEAIKLLDESRMIMIIAKKPDPEVRRQIIDQIKNKPSAFISLGDEAREKVGKTLLTGYIDEAVDFALRQLGEKPLERPGRGEIPGKGNRALLRGFFVGGSLCYQAQAILAREGLKVYSNAPADPDLSLPDEWDDISVCIDTGAEEYVKGKPHPMIDPKARNDMIVKESQRDDVAVILFDVMLGWGSAMDPLDGLEEVRKGPILVTSICGTDQDKQNYEVIRKRLEGIGAKVLLSSGQAAEYAAEIMGGTK